MATSHGAGGPENCPQLGPHPRLCGAGGGGEAGLVVTKRRPHAGLPLSDGAPGPHAAARVLAPPCLRRASLSPPGTPAAAPSSALPGRRTHYRSALRLPGGRCRDPGVRGSALCCRFGPGRTARCRAARSTAPNPSEDPRAHRRPEHGVCSPSPPDVPAPARSRACLRGGRACTEDRCSPFVSPDSLSGKPGAAQQCRRLVLHPSKAPAHSGGIMGKAFPWSFPELPEDGAAGQPAAGPATCGLPRPASRRPRLPVPFHHPGD